MNITTLRCDYMENPIGFDLDRPTLGWIVEASGQNKRQSAYQLQVSLSDTFESPLYDSGKCLSDQSVGIRLALPLSPRTRYCWRVRVYDEQDTASEYSATAFFETGRYAESWQAEFIGGDVESPQLRRAFAIDRPIRAARVYASAAGLYALFLNGRRVGDEVLTPNFNAYDAWIQYQTYDITEQLSQGKNAIAAWLGNGYYKGRVNFPGRPERRNIYGDTLGLIAEIIIDYADGTQQRIGTDESWRVSQSPFLRTEIYDGEVYDARLETEGFDTPALDDSGWAHAVVVPIDKSLLKARLSVPVKVMEKLAPVALITTPLGETVLDFGQNFAGWVRFRTDAPVGAEILFQFGESLDKDGNFYRDNMRGALAELRFIGNGKPHDYAPTFTFFGFRYMRITGWPGDVNLSDFVGEVVHSAIEQTGTFECSDVRVNRLFLNAMWGQRSNFVDTPTDCPQRDERMGWTGDAQVFCATACMNMESNAFFRKYLYDLAVEQQKAGYVPVVIPNVLWGSGIWNITTTGWGDAATIMPFMLYLYYGDVSALEAQYDSMKDWVEYMRAQDTLGVDRYYGFHLGDWLAQDTKDPDNLYGLTPTDLIATAYYAYSAELVAKAAAILGKDEDASEYAALAERIREAFRREYVSESGRIVSETQTAHLIALHMNMVKKEQRPTTVHHLAERLRIDNMLLTTGFLGTPYLCPVLSENGLNEYAYTLLLANKCPSWLYAVEMGATTIWERWNSVRPDGSFGPVSMNSLNHYAFGSIVEWMYRYVLGINPVEDAPAFKRVRLAPMPNDMLQHAEGSIRTQYGTIASKWALEGDAVSLSFTIPFNVTAEIHLPDAEGMQVLENGKPVQGTVLERGSGTWTYVYTGNGKTIHNRVPEKEKANI